MSKTNAKLPFLILVGKSGSGKSSIARSLEQDYGLKEIKTYTSRPKRYFEEDTHTFISRDELLRLTDVVAFTEFNGNLYCTTSEQIDASDIATLDLSGVEYFKKHYDGKKIPVIIYVDVGVLTRFFRMLRRGDGFLKTVKRLWHDRKAFEGALFYCDYAVRNKDLAQCGMQIMNLFKNWEVRDG